MEDKRSWTPLVQTGFWELTLFSVWQLVSARARQLNHRMKNRKSAIVSRRENDASLNPQSLRSIGTLRDSNGNGLGANHTSNGHSQPHSPPSGFVAVNSRQEVSEDSSLGAGQFMFSHPNTDNVTIINGTSIKGASPTTRAELMKKFFTTADRARGLPPEEEGSVRHHSRSRPRASDPGEYGLYAAGPGPVPIPNTPSSLLPQPKSTSHYERDDGGPYKIEMVSRMEDLQRGERIIPPCDRCRRLHMDCLKNLTACMGCTKKHAKCSWKDVKVEELRETQPSSSGKDHQGTNSGEEVTEGDSSNQDLDHGRRGTVTPSGSVSHVRPASEPQLPSRDPPQRRAVSENMTSTAGNVKQTESQRHYTATSDNDDPDANEILEQAIMDTVDQTLARAAAEREKANDSGSGEGERERERERTR